MNDMKTYLDDKLGDMRMREELKQNILDKTMGVEERRGYRFRLPKAVLAAAAFCLMLMTATTAFAAVVPGINDILYSFYPELAESLYPVNQSVSDEGIEVAVLYAANDKHSASVYFSVRDTQMRGRVDETLDLMDTCRIEGPFVTGIQLAAYDEDTQTAFFLMQGNGAHDLSGRMNSFTLRKLMSGKTRYDWYHTGIDLGGSLNAEAGILPQEEYTFTGSGGSSDFGRERQEVLEPDVMDISFGKGIDFAKISNVGFVDGTLHIQTKWEQSFDNRGELWLVPKGTGMSGDEEKAFVPYSKQYFRTGEDEALCGNDLFAKHVEYIYEIGTPEELAGYDLWATFVKDGMQTEGLWKVNFRLQIPDSLVITDGLKTAGQIEVSELGIYVAGYQGDGETCSYGIAWKDGTVWEKLPFTVKIGEQEEAQWNLEAAFPSPIVLEEISSILLDGEVIYEAGER